jgi:hypothetical protein
VGKRDDSSNDQFNLQLLSLDLRVDQRSQFVPVGNALIVRTSVQIVAVPKMMKLSATGGSDVVSIGSTVIGAKAFDDFDNQTNVFRAASDDDAAGAGLK